MRELINPQLTKQVIIGTKSKSRRKIFKMMNLKFQYRSPNINEKKVKNLNNDKYDALKIARTKAEQLSKKYRNRVIVTFDTTILYKKKTIFKCDTEDCCKKTLKFFNNSNHMLYTGMIFMINSNLIKSKLTETKVTFKSIRHADINKYVKKNMKQISSSVGCYNIEGNGKKFFKSIESSYYNVIGINIISFLRTLSNI